VQIWSAPSRFHPLGRDREAEVEYLGLSRLAREHGVFLVDGLVVAQDEDQGAHSLIFVGEDDEEVSD